jgi:hypothetical protein
VSKRTDEEIVHHKAPGHLVSQVERESIRLSAVDAEREEALRARGDVFDSHDRAWMYLITHRDPRVARAVSVCLERLARYDEEARRAQAANPPRDLGTDKEHTNVR